MTEPDHTHDEPEAEPAPRVPRMCDVVHYRSDEPECRPAVITTVGADELIGLYVLDPAGAHFTPDVAHDEDQATGTTWHWRH